MKADNREFVFSWFNTLLVAVIIGLLTVLAANAENNFDFDMLNGLFSPRQSERFFQAGREDFEREVEIFNHPERYLRDDLLHIAPELIEQMDRSREFSDFSQEKSQFKLLFDVAE